MIKKESRNSMRLVRHERIRKNMMGTSACPRLCVFRSNAEIYAQIIDDDEMLLQFLIRLLKDGRACEDGEIISETRGAMAGSLPSMPAFCLCIFSKVHSSCCNKVEAVVPGYTMPETEIVCADSAAV